MAGCSTHLIQELAMPVGRRWHLAIDALGNRLEDPLDALIERLQNCAEGRSPLKTRVFTWQISQKNFPPAVQAGASAPMVFCEGGSGSWWWCR